MPNNLTILNTLEILEKFSSTYNIVSLKANVAGFEFSYINDTGEYCTYVYSFENDYVVEKFYIGSELQFYTKFTFNDFMKRF